MCVRFGGSVRSCRVARARELIRVNNCAFIDPGPRARPRFHPLTPPPQPLILRGKGERKGIESGASVRGGLLQEVSEILRCVSSLAARHDTGHGTTDRRGGRERPGAVCTNY